MTSELAFFRFSNGKQFWRSEQWAPWARRNRAECERAAGRCSATRRPSRRRRSRTRRARIQRHRARSSSPRRNRLVSSRQKETSFRKLTSVAMTPTRRRRRPRRQPGHHRLTRRRPRSNRHRREPSALLAKWHRLPHRSRSRQLAGQSSHHRRQSSRHWRSLRPERCRQRRRALSAEPRNSRWRE